MTRYYRCADRVPGVYGQAQAQYRVTLTGEYRPPRAGEWYVSGAIPEGYRMPHDGTMPHHIARLVRVETVTTVREVPDTLCYMLGCRDASLPGRLGCAKHPHAEDETD